MSTKQEGGCTRSTGMLYSSIGALLLTPDALVLRWISIDHAEVLLWRGAFLTLGFTMIVLMRHRSKSLSAIRLAGWPGVFCGLFFALNTYFFTQALLHTSAAAAMMIISTAPIFAALIGWFWLQERLSFTVGLTIVMTMIGMAIIVSDGSGENSLFGNLMAIGSAAFMAVNFNWARRYAPRDISPGLIFGGVFIFIFGWLGTETMHVRPEEVGAMFLSSAIAMPIGFVLLQIAPRYISATEVSLFLLLESIVAPVWVWLVLDEVPSITTLTGSAVVIFALLFYSNQVRKEPTRVLSLR
ncbi:DMT family transporter [Neptunomonas antarctica]|uniref:Threonine/homoserine efflux transporter RhtA n=1 Tax=Neptunomonas antarctica TaxID=619304 RepID=A0A1N7L3C8_9GAMM|nr:DMT family transporter [Neptunomonas antarctica]SIS68359.1 Threonine/homoserine efflux transporter RhtA [Neptunomonas antarctica]